MPKVLTQETKKKIRDNNELIAGISKLHNNCQFASVYQMLKRNSSKLFDHETISLISNTLNIPIAELSEEAEEINA